MVNNQVGRPGDEPDRQTRGIPESGSDVEEVRNEVPASSGEPVSRPTQTPDQPETIATPDRSVREPGKGPGQDVEFDRNPVMADDDSARPAKAGAVGSGMFFPVIIVIIVAIVLIIWFLM